MCMCVCLCVCVRMYVCMCACAPELERLGSMAMQGSMAIEHATGFRDEVAGKLTKLLCDESVPSAAEVTSKLRRLQALRRKTERTQGWTPWWVSGVTTSSKDGNKIAPQVKSDRPVARGAGEGGGVGKRMARGKPAATAALPDSWLHDADGRPYVELWEEQSLARKTMQGKTTADGSAGGGGGGGGDLLSGSPSPSPGISASAGASSGEALAGVSSSTGAGVGRGGERVGEEGKAAKHETGKRKMKPPTDEVGERDRGEEREKEREGWSE